MESRHWHWLRDLHPQAVVVTGSDRLARHLREQHSALQIESGRTAWERPDILTLAAFARRLWQRCRERDTRLPELLPPAAERLMWEAVTNASEASASLLQPASMARAAADAWNTLQAFPMPRERIATVDKEDTVEFLRLASAFEERLENGQGERRIAGSQLFGQLSEKLVRHTELLPERLHVTGLDEAAPDQKAFIAALAAAGVDVREESDVLAEAHQPESAPEQTSGGNVMQAGCADTDDEIRRAATWAAERIRHDPQCRIGIVALDLEARRDQLQTILREALAPETLPAFSEHDLPFNVSLGRALSDAALVRDALDALALPEEPRPLAWVARLLRSPYLFPQESISRRAKLEHRFRDSGYVEITARHFLAAARNEGLEHVAARLDEFLASHAESRGNGRSSKLPSEWARHFARELGMLGWCARRDDDASHARGALSSREFQAREAFHELLGELGSCDVLEERWTRSRAVSELRRLANERLFQPRAVNLQERVPVQVLGWLEATGLEFDALWVMGLEDTVLPAAPRPHPLLPVHLQREFDWPHSSAEREYAFAERQLARLKRAANEVILSYPKMDGDRLLRPSPLLSGIESADLPAPQPRLAEHATATARLEQLEDIKGPAISDDIVRGGTRFIEDQSACAFRAFAVHRLQAHDWPTPRPGPDPRLRGSLVHDALEALWERWQQRSIMATLADEERRSVIREVVRSVVEESRQRRPALWPRGLAELEIQRLASLIDEWLALERERADFTVIGRELAIEVQAGPLRMRGRIDRIDRMSEGELLIDYKTGGSLSTAGWEGRRPASPQLPLYAINRRQPPIGIAFGKLRAGESKFAGIAACDTGTSGIDDVTAAAEKKDAADWESRMVEWRDVLAQLGSEAHAGRAEPDPLPGACTFCHLRTLCRIDELTGEASALLEEGFALRGAGDAD